MGVVKNLYKEIFCLLSFGVVPHEVLPTIIGEGMIVYGYDGEDDIRDVRDLVRAYNTNYIGIHPTISQLYYLHLKHNRLNILECLSVAPLSYDTERAIPTYSSWVDIPDVVAFYKKFSIKKFTNTISFSKK